MSGEASPINTKLHRYLMTFLRGFESGLGKKYTRISSDDIPILSPDLYYYEYNIAEPIHGAVDNTLSVHMRVYDFEDDYEIEIFIDLKLATKIESSYEVLVASKYRYICVEDFCSKIAKATSDDDPFNLGYKLGSEFREMIQDLRRASSNKDERLKWVLGIEVLRILMINDIALDRNSPLVKKAEYIDKLYDQISDKDRAIFEDYMAKLGSYGVYHTIAHYDAIFDMPDPSKYGTSLLKHLIEKGEIRLRRDGLYVKGKKIEPLDFGKIGVFISRDYWMRIYARYVWLHIKYRYYRKILDELAEYGYDPVDAGELILLTILHSKADRDWNPADELLIFSFMKIRGRDGKQVDLIEEVVRRRPNLASMIIGKIVESEFIIPQAMETLMKKIGDYIPDKEKIDMLNRLFIKALKMTTSDSGADRDKIIWFSMINMVAKSIPRLRDAIYHSSGWKTMALMRDGGRMCIPLYLESRGGSIGGIFGLYYYDEDYGDVLVPIRLDDIDMIGRMGKKDIEKIWGEMKKLLIDPEASALVELVELREDIKIPIINIYDSPTPLSSDMNEIIKTLAKKLPIAILDKQTA